MAKTSPKDSGLNCLALQYFPQTDGDPKPWLPQPDETYVEFYQFKFYLDLGVSRTLRAVCDATFLSPAVAKSLAKKRDWDGRVLAYERHLIDVEMAAREQTTIDEAVDWAKRRSQIRESAFQTSQLLIDKARQMLATPLETVTESTVESVDDETGAAQTIKTVIHMPARWGFRDAAAFLKTADDMSRLAADMSTSNVNVNVNERRVELTVQMVVDMSSRGMELSAIKQKLIEVGVESGDIDKAVQIVKEKR